MSAYAATRDRVEHYFDRTATSVWERLTSDAPVSGIRATVRAGRDRMRDVMLGQLPADLTGLRILDAGCGTGAMAVALAERGAQVTAVDISPALVDIAQKRMPETLNNQITWHAGDMTDTALGSFDHALAMDSMIYYTAPDLAQIMAQMAPRISGTFVFTLPPKTPLLMAMFRVGKLFPRKDRSPVMIPQATRDVDRAFRAAGLTGPLTEVERITSGFYISNALSYGAKA